MLAQLTSSAFSSPFLHRDFAIQLQRRPFSAQALFFTLNKKGAADFIKQAGIQQSKGASWNKWGKME